MGVRVRERPKGSGFYWVFVDHKGKRKAKKVGDKKAALSVAKRLQAELTLGQLNILDQQSIPKFKLYAEQWLETYIKALRRAATYERYESILRMHIYPEIGHLRLDEIKRGEIRTLLLKAHAKPLSRSMVCLIRDVISGVLGYALDEELLLSNPATGVMRRMNFTRKGGTAVEPLTQDEIDLFLKTCTAHKPAYYPFFLCAFRTGMRLGELLALRWGDIDWNKKFIRVEKAYKRGCINQTKTGNTRRVDMSDQLAGALKTLLTERKKEALKMGRGEPVEIIFHKNGSHMEQNYIRYIYKKLLRKAGIRTMRLHDIRHTFASLLLSNGESPVYVKEQLGHTTIQMTVDIYGHLIPSSNRQAVNKLDTSAPLHIGDFQKSPIAQMQQSATYTQPEKEKACN